MNGQKKRGRPKKKTFNEMLRAKMEPLFADAVERQMPKKLDRENGEFKTSENTRRKNRESVNRYYHTEKGKENNRKSCRQYYHNHPERVKGYVARYKEKFEAKWGVSLSTWLYWLSRLNKGIANPEQVPERFVALVENWKEKQQVQ